MNAYLFYSVDALIAMQFVTSFFLQCILVLSGKIAVGARGYRAGAGGREAGSRLIMGLSNLSQLNVPPGSASCS